MEHLTRVFIVGILAPFVLVNIYLTYELHIFSVGGCGVLFVYCLIVSLVIPKPGNAWLTIKDGTRTWLEYDN